MPQAAPSGHSVGEYRCRDRVSVVDGVLLSTKPLVATRLNDAAVDLLTLLADGGFHSPKTIAAATQHDTETVARLFDRLYRRGLLEWRPASDPEFQPAVSIVITVRNDSEQLEQCLDSIAALTYPDYEVVVVDDGSTDGMAEMLNEHKLSADSRSRVISVGGPDAPLGIGASRNRGIEAAEHDIIAFTDADCRPQSDWLTELVPHLAANDLVGGRIRPAGSTTASTYEGINSSLDMGKYGSRIRPEGTTPYLATANLVGRRKVFETTPFPERNVAEDVDVCWRAVDAGFSVVYTPSGIVEHAYRDDICEFANRRSTYGASEALLARSYGHDAGGSIDIPISLVLVAVVTLLGTLQSGLLSTVAFWIAGSLIVTITAIHGWALLQRYRRLPSIVSMADLMGSWGRETLSSVYAASREVMRYYSIPITLAAGLTWFAGARHLAMGLLVTGVAALALPLVVEYYIHEPDISLPQYGVYYLADHLGYQYGIYRGAVEHRTLAHLLPHARFRLVGPGRDIFA